MSYSEPTFPCVGADKYTQRRLFMRGSMRGQILHLYNASGMNQLGTSKHDAKNNARAELKANGQSASSANIASKTGIHSVGTQNNYVGKMIELAEYTRDEYGIKDVMAIEPEHVQNFLLDKIEAGISLSHFSGYVASFSKMESAMQAYSDKNGLERTWDVRNGINELRDIAKTELDKDVKARDYDNPRSMIDNLERADHRLVASMQLEGGFRISEALDVKASNLKGLTHDAVSDSMVGRIEIESGKGGKANVASVSPETYKELQQHISEKEGMKISPDGYRNGLKEASERTGQDYHGSHGLRWNFAQDRFSEAITNGMTHEQALGLVSHELGHERISITNLYLGNW